MSPHCAGRRQRRQHRRSRAPESLAGPKELSSRVRSWPAERVCTVPATNGHGHSREARSRRRSSARLMRRVHEAGVGQPGFGSRADKASAGDVNLQRRAFHDSITRRSSRSVGMSPLSQLRSMPRFAANRTKRADSFEPLRCHDLRDGSPKSRVPSRRYAMLILDDALVCL